MKYYEKFNNQRCQLTFGEDPYGVIIETTSTSGVKVNSRNHASCFFQSYQVASRNSNMIGIQLPVQAFQRVLRAARGNEVRMLLANNAATNTPLLRIMSRQSGKNERFDIRIELLSDMKVSQVREDNVPEYSQSVFLPKIESVHHIVKTLARNDDIISLKYTVNAKQLALSSESHQVAMDVGIDDVVTASIGEDTAPPPAESKARIHTRDLVPALELADIRPTDVILAFMDDGGVWTLVMQPGSVGETQLLTVLIPRSGRS